VALFQVKMVSPEKTVWEGKASLATFRTLEGSMGVLDKRAPLVVSLDVAPLKLQSENGPIEFAVHGGILKMDGELLIVITDAAERVEDIDIYRAEAARKRAMDRLEKARNDRERIKAKFSLQKNLLRERLGKER